MKWTIKDKKMYREGYGYNRVILDVPTLYGQVGYSYMCVTMGELDSNTDLARTLMGRHYIISGRQKDIVVEHAGT